MKQWYQTDFDGIIRADGCLVFSMLDMCYEMLLGMGHSPRDVEKGELEEIFSHAHRRGYIQRNLEDPRFGMYVMDHSGMVNELLSFLIEPYVRCEYVAAEYVESEMRESWGEPETGDQIILQVRTGRGGGHFRRLCYDPWQPSPGIAKIRSVRYYQFWEEAHDGEKQEVEVGSVGNDPRNDNLRGGRLRVDHRDSGGSGIPWPGTGHHHPGLRSL